MKRTMKYKWKWKYKRVINIQYFDSNQFATFSAVSDVSYPLSSLTGEVVCDVGVIALHNGFVPDTLH